MNQVRGSQAVYHNKKHFLYVFGTWWIKRSPGGGYIHGEGKAAWTSLIS